ncbi:hypothetical protein AXF42_Ash010707 [Apostasia shenzhenica]|uniref:Uncharacterized protein n=1 Tax=Apostasia shenzhenica TaxID=1088818 RepID=A0A2I0A6V6_9ASPA|nr:hypothetical protein AXF42_Ash010707 [Apostasia shenzhenica]
MVGSAFCLCKRGRSGSRRACFAGFAHDVPSFPRPIRPHPATSESPASTISVNAASRQAKQVLLIARPSCFARSAHVQQIPRFPRRDQRAEEIAPRISRRHGSRWLHSAISPLIGAEQEAAASFKDDSEIRTGGHGFRRQYGSRRLRSAFFH